MFVHGFQGNSFDFRLWKCYFFAKYPYFLYLSSSANEEDTNEDIWVMGINLAKEIKKYIHDRVLYKKNLRYFHL